jgi:antitoxin component YwqK of YwqJK toxin-antitoxin module|tara:strand:+ start:995 stop:2158 length:1164 start_codon:yes stop_codon:yes gene_type:complete
VGIFDFFKKKPVNNNDLIDSNLRINWDQTEDIGIITHFNGKPFTGICFSLNDNNNLDEETELVNGLKHGKSKEYHNDGELFKEINYKNDLLDGINKWYSDGILSVESNYRKGEEHGLHNEYDKEGRLSIQVNYKQGIQDGLYYKYENGELKEEGKYKVGKRDGLWKIYFNNGKLSEEGYYNEDERDGIWKVYNNSDKPERKVIYGKNKFEEVEKSSNSSKEPIQNENGFNRIISDDGSFQEVYKERGRFTKEFKQFNDKGVLVYYRERIIHNNVGKDKKLLPDGIEKTYYQDGLLKTKVSFIKGQREGLGTEYDEDGWLVNIEYYKNDENVAWDNNENMKLVLREILNIMDNQIPMMPVLYLGMLESLGYKGDWNEDSYYIISQSLI